MEHQQQQLGAWIAQAREHWEEFQPTRFKELQEAGKLEESLREAAMQTSEEMRTLMDQGTQWHEAWEMVREMYLFPPEEEGLDPFEGEEMPAAAGYRELRRAIMLQQQLDDLDD